MSGQGGLPQTSAWHRQLPLLLQAGQAPVTHLPFFTQFAQTQKSRQTFLFLVFTLVQNDIHSIF